MIDRDSEEPPRSVRRWIYIICAFLTLAIIVVVFVVGGRLRSEALEKLFRTVNNQYEQKGYFRTDPKQLSRVDFLLARLHYTFGMSDDGGKMARRNTSVSYDDAVGTHFLSYVYINDSDSFEWCELVVNEESDWEGKFRINLNRAKNVGDYKVLR